MEARRATESPPADDRYALGCMRSGGRTLRPSCHYVGFYTASGPDGVLLLSLGVSFDAIFSRTESLNGEKGVCMELTSRMWPANMRPNFTDNFNHSDSLGVG